MNEELKQYAPELEAIISAIHRATAVIGILSLLGFVLGGWLWYLHQHGWALGVVVVSYLFFRLYPLLSLQWARWRASDDVHETEALTLLERHLRGQNKRRVLLGIDAWLRDHRSERN